MKATIYRIDKITHSTVEDMWSFPTYEKAIKTQEAFEAEAENKAGRMSFVIMRIEN